MRAAQAAAAGVVWRGAAVRMFDARGGALRDPTGVAPGGLRGGWYPFWSAAVIAAAGVLVAIRSATTPQPAEGVFRDRGRFVDLLRFVVPMALATWLMSPGLLGFYLASGLYVAYYAGVVARYRWWVSLASGAAIPVATYLVFEIGFSALLPKSFLYPGSPF